MKFFVLGLIAAVSFPSSAYAGCPEVAMEAMQDMGVTTASEKPTYMEKIGVGKKALVTNYRAWFRLARCERGHMVVNMERTCALTDTWTSSACETDVGSIRAN